MKTSTRDKVEGTAKSAAGKAQQKLGRATGNARQQDKGTAKRAEGKVQKKAGDVKKVFGR